MTAFGIEGEQFDFIDGVPVFREEWGTHETRFDALGVGNYYNPFRMKALPMIKFYHSAADLEFKAMYMPTDPPLFNEAPFASFADYLDLSMMELEYYQKFVSGVVDLDAGFDKFVQD